MVEVGGGVGGGEAAEEVTVGWVLDGGFGFGGGVKGRGGEGGMGVQGAVELVGGHGCGCLMEGGREVGA